MFFWIGAIFAHCHIYIPKVRISIYSEAPFGKNIFLVLMKKSVDFAVTIYFV